MPPIRWKSPNTPKNPHKPGKMYKGFHTEDEWEMYKALILELRKTENVPGLVNALAQFGFETTKPQLKYHLKKWGDKKYLKLTEPQLAYIAEQILDRQKTGQKAALRIDGTKVPSKKAGRILMEKEDILRRVTRVNEELLEDEGQVQNDELETGLSSATLARAPTIIDSFRITVYTSSTAQGIRDLFRRFMKAPPADDDDEAEQAIAIERQPQANEILVDRPILGLDYQPVLRLQFFVPTERPPEATWDALSEKIFGYDNGNKDSTLAVLAFKPKFAQHPSTGQRLFVISEDELKEIRNTIFPSITPPTWPITLHKAYGVHVAKGSLQFKDFLELHSNTLQLYRRVIDVNDCPTDIWAIDVSRYIPWPLLSRQWYDPVAGRYLDYAEMVGWIRPGCDNEADCFRSKPSYCLAWCTREPTEWNEWLAGLSDQNRFMCGHEGSALKCDGPVIFTNTLIASCWRKSGCQWDRIAKSMIRRCITDEPDVYMSWSTCSYIKTEHSENRG